MSFFVFFTSVHLVAPADILKCAYLLCRAPSDPSQAGKRPSVAADSEVYKMLQENQESDEPPRQSASFKVLQEILETGTDPAYLTASPKGNQAVLFYNV